MPAIRLAQLQNRRGTRHVVRVTEPNLLLLEEYMSTLDLAEAAIGSARRIGELLAGARISETLDYDRVYRGESDWKLLPCFDHPSDPSRCLVTGTGLTHRASAENRQSMHGGVSSANEAVTDSMRMYRIGLEGGRPERACVGAQPEWFYKGTGSILRAHNDPLHVPCFAHDGGEEAEIAGVYVISPDGTPYRVGLTQGNEFSDHVLEAKNYLYLAQSKLRDCSIGPELVIDPDFDEVRGGASVERDGKIIWQADQASGEKGMCHTLANLEHHHFKVDSHRIPGDAHVHFFGADAFSFRDRLELNDGDVMTVAFEGFGRPLRNPIRIDRSGEKCVEVKRL
jgi:hypothetical protein